MVASPRPWLVALFVMSWSSSLWADGLSVAVALPEGEAKARDAAAAVVYVAEARFKLSSPRLSVESIESCRGDERCLVGLAAGQASDGLLLIGIAALGPGESVLSLKVLSVVTGQALVEGTELVGRGQGLKVIAVALAERVLADPALASLPQPRADASATPSHESTASPPPSGQERWLASVGVGLIGLATVVECVSFVAGAVAWFGAEESATARVEAVSPMVLVGAATLGLYALGLVGVLLDPWLPSEAGTMAPEAS